MDAQDVEPTVPTRKRRRRGLAIALAFVAVVVLAIGGAIVWVLGESGLPFLVARVVAQSGGRLAIEGASGSVASTMRFARLTWNGGDTTVEARDVIVEWQPQALWHKRVEIRSLGASRMSIAMKPSSGPTPPPTDLALPLDVDIANVAINTLEWRAGPRGGTITGLALAYRGSASEHVVQGLHLASEFGSLSGDVRLGAHAPLALGGTLGIVGDGPLAGARLDTTLGGTLAKIALDAHGDVRGAAVVASASLTPFTTAPLERAHATVSHLDAHAFVDTLPTTAVDVVADVQPDADGFAGTAQIVNQVPGPLDAERLPFVDLRGRYRWRPSSLDVDDVVATVPGNGTVTGRAHVALGTPDAATTLALTLRNVDPQRLHRKLMPMRLAGQVTGEVNAGRQVVAGTLSDGANVARFEATVANRLVDLRNVELRTAGGALAGRGTLALDGARAFEAHVVATHFDPSRYVAGAAASLDGTIDVRGTLQPALAVHADAKIQSGSRYANVPVAGTVRGDVAWPRLRNVVVDATAGSAHVTLHGDTGAVGDQLAFTIAAPRAQDVAALLPAAVRPASGAVQAQGTVRLEPGGPGGDVTARVQGLRLADGTTVATLALDATVAPGGAAARPQPIEARRFEVKGSGSGVAVAGHTLDDVGVDVAGTLGEHVLRLRGRSEGLAVEAAAHGRLTLARDLAASSWEGGVDALTTSGRLALRLRSPATLALARDRQRLADAHLDVADGRADIAELRVVGGRVTTQGSFTGVPLASVLALAGTTAPLATTLVLGGDWQIDAAPQLNGRFTVKRERGDLYGSETVPDATRTGLAFGITALELSGTLRNDALVAHAAMRSTRAGSADGEVTIGSVAGATEGHLAPGAPLTGRLDAELASLAPLQPLLGTQAVVNGRVRAALRATGTLGAPQITGTVDGDALRVDAPQYGIHVTDGRVRARLAEGALALDELSFAGGDGRFTAQGVVALPGQAARATEVTWRAEHFRVADRPDLRLVVAGNGTLGFADKRVALKGQVRVEEGHVEYEASPPGRLGAGRRRERPRGRCSRAAAPPPTCRSRSTSMSISAARSPSTARGSRPRSQGACA